MAWRRTLDANGNPILRNTETGEERPVERVAPESVAAPESAPIQAPAPSAPIQAPGPPTDPRTAQNDLGTYLRSAFGDGPPIDWLGRRLKTADTEPVAEAPVELDFGDSSQLRPADQALFDRLSEMLTQGGGSETEMSAEPEVTGTPGDRAAADLDSATSFMSLGLPDPSQGDPGLEVLARGAREDRDRFAPILERELGRATTQRDLYSTENPRRNTGYNIAMFLGRLLSGERGDVAGDMIRDRQGTEQAWTDRIIQLTQAGMSMDRAIREADAAVLSSGYQTGIGLEERDYSRGVTERQEGRADRALDIQSNQGDRQLQLMLAQILQEGLQRTEESNLAAAGALMESPLADQASRYIAGVQVPGATEETQGVLASTLSQRAKLAPVIERVLSGISRGDVRDIRREANRAAAAQGITLTPSDLALIERTVVQSRIGQPAE